MPESLGIRVTTSNGRNDWSAIEKRTKGFIKPKDEDIIKNTTFSLDFHPHDIHFLLLMVNVTWRFMDAALSRAISNSRSTIS